MRKRLYLYLRRLRRTVNRHLKVAKKASKHPFAIPTYVFSGLLVLTLGGLLIFKPNHPGNAPVTKVVIISHDNVKQIVPSIEPTVGKLLAKLNIVLRTGDVVQPSLNTVINQDDFRINIYRAVPVEIIENGVKKFTFSAAVTPRAIVEQAGIKLYPQDYVYKIPTANFLTENAIGERVVVVPAVPINLNLYGSPVQIRTHASTVANLIKDEHINITSDNQIIPSLSTPITPNMQIFIVRPGEKLQSITQSIPMPIETIYDNSLSYGTNAIQQQGSSGQEVVTYKLQINNGIVVGRTPIQTIVSIPPVTEIVLEGINLSGIQGDMALAGIAPQDYGYASYIISHESGWCPTKAQGETYCPAVPDNPMTSGGYGLCQATPGYLMAADGSDWETNPITQLRWCSGHAESRYGGWQNAYDFWVQNRWW